MPLESQLCEGVKFCGGGGLDGLGVVGGGKKTREGEREGKKGEGKGGGDAY